MTRQNGEVRLGLLLPVKIRTPPGLGWPSHLLLLALLYVVSVLFWSFWLWEGVHWGGAETWSYFYTCTHWGALAPFVVG